MEYEKGKVSVVIPTYNQEKFIAETIESVLNQTYKKLEIVICDDCSSDNTAEIIKKYSQKDNRIKALFSEKNQGISRNFNKAFDNCTGEFTAFLGGDDLMFPQKVATQVSFLQQNPEYVLSMHYIDIFDSDTNKTLYTHGTVKKEGKLPENPLDWVFAVNWFRKKYTSVIPSSCLARSEYYLSARYDERLRFKHELLFTLDAYMKNPVGKWYIEEEVLGKYRVHQNNFSMQDKNKSLINEESLMLYGIAFIRYPQLGKRLKSYKDYTLFNQLLNNWIDKKERSYYEKQFFIEAGFFKYLYLQLRRLLRKIK